ncbi:Cupredoxin [Metarhizium robertsii ARSEF 23]|uniref:Cupredoxin n=2 Tax=Metarhizium robertsii TaxID=568076 RepID=E9EZC9_METRA|nr:Cupredoxin [Metarhizium robertsii ARSEF 23]EFY99320.2 Cupredoxin [Metarhizium robertsii ARSEF 23]
MKYSTTIFTALAPLAMARRVANVFPPSPGIVERNAETESSESGIQVSRGKQVEAITANSRAEVIVIWLNPGNGASKTSINEQVTVTRTVTAGAGGEATQAPGGSATASAPGTGATHTIKVGGENGLAFSPQELRDVPMGDMLLFEFGSQNHTVTQAEFATPCQPMAGGMDSGFLANPNNTVSPPPQVAMQVMTDKPLWFFCAQKGHCGKGMVLSINPTAEKTHAMFQGMAIAQNGAGSATPITGGQQGSTPPPPSAPGGVGGNSTGGAGGAGGSGSSGGNSGVTPGKATMGADGSYHCVVTCNSGSFPDVSQGVGAFGGMSGALPV